jgi:Pterin 4 alpha carbinolamine dehydratase
VELNGIKRLTRVYSFDDFAQALEFTNKVGELADEEGHHPALLTDRHLVDARDQRPASQRFRHGGQDRRAVSALIHSPATRPRHSDRVRGGGVRAGITDTHLSEVAEVKPRVALVEALVREPSRGHRRRRRRGPP